MAYKKEVKLKHNERAAKVNIETGELIEIKEYKNNLPKEKRTFGIIEKKWRKSFDPSWDFLDEVLTDLEHRVVSRMCRMALINSNSLQPLNDETAAIELSAIFKIDHRKAKKMFNKFLQLGIYGKFEVVKENQPYTKYWILNPYLVFSGRLINSDIATLFEGTRLTNEYFKRMHL
jgi:hypothetical protein